MLLADKVHLVTVIIKTEQFANTFMNMSIESKQYKLRLMMFLVKKRSNVTPKPSTIV